VTDRHTADHLLPGQPLAPGYVVVEHLQRGRRLDVYDVWSEERYCRCIAKTLRPDRADDRRGLAQLRLEGRLLSRLAHPHLVRAYETTMTLDQPRPALILEAVPGTVLDEAIGERGRLRPQEVARLGLQLSSVLHYLHGRGWLHLDVKPSNVIASDRGVVLIDLSLAARIGKRSSGGTFDYRSPEQAHRVPLTEAADVWGLGGTLYAALSGVAPYAEWEYDSEERPRYPQLDARPLPLAKRGRFPRLLRAVIDACLELDLAARPGLTEIATALEAFSGLDPRTDSNSARR